MREFSADDIINAGLCIGCGSCVAQRSANATMKMDDHAQLKPRLPKQWLKERTEKFSATCPFSPAAANESQLADILFPDSKNRNEFIGRYEQAYVGYANEDFRMNGSSGGMVSWVAAELFSKGLIDHVAHVTECDPAEGKFFKYTISSSVEEIQRGAKSRYYPVELSEILTTIKNIPGRYAIIGVPCFVKAIQLLRQNDPVYRERICFTLGLFCGHMKSARFVESFAWQMNVNVQDVSKVEFRYKDPSRPANWYNAMLTLKNGNVINRDWWHLADGDWGAGFFMNHACNFCDDVVAETADISFGDAWLEPYSSDGRGTNVVVVRSGLINELLSSAIHNGTIHLTEVESDFVIETQAAGFRQRREGLAYRLTWAKPLKELRKRVLPDNNIPLQRKLIYRMRYYLSKGSHKFSKLSHSFNKPSVYINWATAVSKIYAAFAYHRGKLGSVVKRLTA